MKPSRDVLPVIFLFAILIAVTGYGASRRAEAEAEYPPGSIRSTLPEGGRALYLWLHELGYPTSVIEGSAFAIDRNIKLLFLLAPFTELRATFGLDEINVVDNWVRQGGTLIIIEGNRWDALLRHFDFRAEWNRSLIEQATLVQPLLVSPPFITVTINSRYHLADNTLGEAVVHLASDKQPALLSRAVGKGQVFVMAGLHPFTNQGLHNPSNAALVYSLILTGAGRDGTVAFDEYHHGAHDTTSLQTWLVGTPPGWAILYGALVAFAYLLISGKRFGAPVPLPEHIARRSTAEFIAAMANLRRRAGRRHDALRHYKEQLKRRLARPYRIDPKLADDRFVQELARCDPLYATRRADLTELLAKLNRQRVSEREMINLAGQAADWPKQ